jgi:hypothetical protein
MKPNANSFKRSAIAFAAVAFYVVAGSAPASAQSERCTDLYGHVMGLYQTAPYSPEYSRLSAYYSSRCLMGSSAGPAYYAPYQAPYASYQQPVVVDPGAIIGGILTGATVGAWENDDDDYYRYGRTRRFR